MPERGRPGEGTHRRRLPAWLAGMLVAAVVLLALILLFTTLGIGDDPVIQGLAIGRE